MLMLSRSAAEEATQLILCRILAFVTCAAGADPGAGTGAGTGDSGDVGAVAGAAAEAMLKELLALLPSADLTGCVGK
jgi:hypothetical protein